MRPIAIHRMRKAGSPVVSTGPVYQNQAGHIVSASATSRTPGKGTVSGLNGALIAYCVSKNNATHNCSTTGWSKLGQWNTGLSNFTVSLWIASENVAAGPTISWTGAAACIANTLYYANPAGIPVDLVNVLFGASGSGTGTTHTSTGFTTDAANVLAVALDNCGANTAVSGWAAGWTENLDFGSTTGPFRYATASKSIAASGTASGSLSLTGGNAVWQQIQFQLKDAA